MAKRLNNLAGKDWLRYSFSIWRDISKNKEESKLKHPAMFPIQLAERFIEIFTDATSQQVLDPFMGSGSTGKACKLEGFDFIGFEKEEEYCNIAEARINSTEPELKLAI